MQKKIVRFLLSAFLILLVAGCVTSGKDDASKNGPSEDLSALDNSTSGDDSLESDLGKNENNTEALNSNKDEIAQFEDDKSEQSKKATETEKKEEVPPTAQTPPQEAPTAPVEPPPEFNSQNEIPKPEAPAEAQVANSGLVTIKALQFKGNDNGGTLIIEGDGPMTYSTRMNSSTGQYVIDIPQTKLPKKLSRPLITKDFEGIVGSVDAYQTAGSNVTRVIVHLRAGAPEPVVQSEGTALLVVANDIPVNPEVSVGASKENKPEQSALMSYASLEEFLAGNMNFSGKKISIETDQIEMKDLFKLISEEAGVNLVISDEVRGSMSVKLRQVPWDQALVMVMKAKKLSYTRSGNILRIAAMTDLRMEEDEAVKLANSKKSVAPLVVRTISVNYADVVKTDAQVKPFLSERGKLVNDPRTNAIIISDIEENVDRIAKLIQVMDIPPQQVLIEGKVVEAQDEFQRAIGINWSNSGATIPLGSQNASFNFDSSTGSKGGFGTLNFTLGTLDVLGDISSTLSLQEREGNVKILSSPRVVTMHNEEATIEQSQELPIITTITTNGVATPQVSYKNVSLKLTVNPSITNDGSVLMKVGVNREFAGTIADQQTQARPINKRAANTKVLVRNGQTAVIGGIYQDDYADGTNKIPWIADVPIIGWLFKSNSKQDIKNELLIFITPRVLGQIDSQTIPQQKTGGEG